MAVYVIEVLFEDALDAVLKLKYTTMRNLLNSTIYAMIVKLYA